MPALRRGILILILLLPRLTRAAEPQEEPISLAFWDKSVSLRGAFGYKDNVLLSHVQPEGSSFWLSALDFTLIRAALDNSPTFTFFISGEDRRYFSAPDLDKEQLLLAQAKLTKPLTSDWTWGGLAQYLYADEVFDASSTEQVLEILPVKSHNIQFGPLLSRDLPGNSSLELRFTAERQIFMEPLDSYWQLGPQLTFTKKYGHHSEASLSYTYGSRSYDTRAQLNFDLTPVTNALLRFEQNRLEASLDHSWDKERRWRNRVKFLFEINQDNGTGFFDFYRYRLSGRFGYYRKSWQATVEGKILHYDYLTQPIFEGGGVRQTWEYVATAHIEKNIWKHLKIYAEAEHDTMNSNYAFEQYHANTFLGGFDCEF